MTTKSWLTIAQEALYPNREPIPDEKIKTPEELVSAPQDVINEMRCDQKWIEDRYQGIFKPDKGGY